MEKQVKKRPNIMMICTDHWPSSLFNHMGNDVILTPTLDLLAKNGIRFTNLYSECPVCIPARRTLMTGLSPRSHGDRVYTDDLEMPDVATLAQCFRDEGYQAYAVGKLHVYPQRDRIGFDEVILEEEGRYEFGLMDDYQIFLAQKGYAGQQFMHGMGNNTYYTRPWHLPEDCHVTKWATSEMIKTIKRKDPTRPAFYYLSYSAPHPPLVPIKEYWDMYKDVEIDEGYYGDWLDDNIYFLQALSALCEDYTEKEKELAKKAFYSQCTYIDHQIRLIIGTLREEELLDDTIILFLSDHGDMLFNHNMLGKRCFYEDSTNIPFIVSGKPLEEYFNIKDERLLCLADIMPTLLDLCHIKIPESVEGISAFSNKKREYIYGEISEDKMATRMIRKGDYKLIYYPVGNYKQVFNIKQDPKELKNLAGLPAYKKILDDLVATLIKNLYKEDLDWLKDGELVGYKNQDFVEGHNYGLSGQRGGHITQPKKRK